MCTAGYLVDLDKCKHGERGGGRREDGARVRGGTCPREVREKLLWQFQGAKSKER